MTPFELISPPHKTPEKQKFIIDHIRHLSQERGIGYKNLAPQIGLNRTEQQISRFVNHPDKHDLREDEYELIIRYIVNNQMWESRKNVEQVKQTPNHLYFSLIDFFDVTWEREYELRNAITGLYKAYGIAVTSPEFMMVTSMLFDLTEPDYAVHVTQRFAYPEEDHPGAAERTNYGYASPVQNRIMCLLRQDDNLGTKILFLNPLRAKDGRIQALTGADFFLFGNDNFATRIFLERFHGTPEELQPELGVRPVAEMPRDIYALMFEPTTPSGTVRF